MMRIVHDFTLSRSYQIWFMKSFVFSQAACKSFYWLFDYLDILLFQKEKERKEA